MFNILCKEGTKWEVRVLVVKFCQEIKKKHKEGVRELLAKVLHVDKLTLFVEKKNMAKKRGKNQK